MPESLSCAVEWWSVQTLQRFTWLKLVEEVAMQHLDVYLRVCELRCVCVCVWAMPYFLVWCPIGHAHYTCSNRPPFKAKPSRGKDRPREQSRCFHMLLIDRQVPFLMLSATRHLEFSLFQFTSMLRLPWHNRSVGLSLQTFEVCKPSAAPDLTQAVPWFKQSPFQFFRKRDPTRRMHVIRTRGLEEHETDWSVWDFSVSSKLTEHVCIFYSS